MDPAFQPQTQGAQAGPVNPYMPPAGVAPGTAYIPPHDLAQTAANIQPMAQPAALPPQPAAPAPMPQAPVQNAFAQYQQSANPFAPAAPNPSAPPIVQGGAQQPAPGALANPGVAPAHTNPNSTQNMLQIAEIRDGIVIMSDGSFRSVVMVKSINFDLMSPQEQEAIEYSYQGFLNSLYFPVQVFIRSQKVDLQPYIDKLDKIRTEHENMLLALLMEDYITYIDQLSQATNIMDKKFYIVIPYFPHIDVQKALTQSKNFINGIISLFETKDQHVVVNENDLEKAKTELRNRVQAVLSGLMQSGIQGLPLDTQELIELYYDTYNPDTATRQQLKNFEHLSADIITKGEGTAVQAHLQRELG